MTVKGEQATEAESDAFFIVLDILKELRKDSITDYPQGFVTVIMDALREKFDIKFKENTK